MVSTNNKPSLRIDPPDEQAGDAGQPITTSPAHTDVTIRQKWQEFCRHTAPAQISQDELEAWQELFYEGANAALECINDIMSAPDAAHDEMHAQFNADLDDMICGFRLRDTPVAGHA